jgi:RNA polymerase sigma-70 factor (ECF subfamily)
MHYRKANKKQAVELNENDLRTLLDEVTNSGDEEQMQLVINGLNQLPLEQMDLIDMRFFEKRSFREIGEIIFTTEGNAKIKLYRALDKLKKIILSKS